MSDKPGAWMVLRRELDAWHEAGLTATFWWRDDDACVDTPELKRLHAMSEQLRLPVSIAVIPSKLEDSLPTYLQGKRNFTVLQHGFAHLSYAAKGEKKIEIGGERDEQAMYAELKAGRSLLKGAFSGQFVDVLVPPWNRIAPGAIDGLSGCGFAGVSSMWARIAPRPAPQLLQVNTHLDPVNWRHGAGFLGDYRAIAQIHRHLYARRTGRRDRDEPTGILTHHLVQDDDVWEFCLALMLMLKQHPAARWLSAQEIWRDPSA